MNHRREPIPHEKTPESVSGSTAYAELEARRERWVEQVSKRIQLPEPSLVLDFSDRRSRARRFKHLHQTCMFHRENYWATNQVKHLYLVDGFLAMTAAANPMGMYAVARSMFELSAFLHEIQVRLQEVTLQVNDKNWQPMGEQFFGLIVRARFATTHPDLHEMLLADGVPKSRLETFHIMNCIRGLAAEPEHQDAMTRYATLCDFVHHNLGSSTLANSGSAEADVARSAGGGEIRSTSGPLTITQYEYPVVGKVDRAVADLAPGFLRDALSCVGWLNMTPAGPFPQQMVVEVTGSRFGLQEFRRGFL